MQEKSDRYTDEQRAARRRIEHRRKRRIAQHNGKEKLSKEVAIQMMHYLAEQTNKWISAYPCEFCEWWHNGEFPKQLRAAVLYEEEEGEVVQRAERPEIQAISQSLGDLFGDKFKGLFE